MTSRRVTATGIVKHKRVGSNGGVGRAGGVEQQRCRANCGIGIRGVENQRSTAHSGVEAALHSAEKRIPTKG